MKLQMLISLSKQYFELSLNKQSILGLLYILRLSAWLLPYPPKCKQKYANYQSLFLLYSLLQRTYCCNSKASGSQNEALT